jgi:CheY-like chemotaxis protein
LISEDTEMIQLRDKDESIGKVLVMDEEAVICELITRMLARSGIEVISVNDAEAAVQQYRIAKASGQPFDKVILDLKIDRKTVALKILERLKLIDPHIKAIVQSGDIFNEVMVSHKQFGFQAALAKPYSSQELISVVLE